MTLTKIFPAVATGFLLAACGNPPPVEMPDMVMVPNAAVSPSTLDFMKLHCGAAATVKNVTLTNSGSAELTYTATVTGTGYSVDPASGKVAAGQSATLKVSATAAATSTAAAALAGSLKVTTNDSAHATLTVP